MKATNNDSNLSCYVREAQVEWTRRFKRAEEDDVWVQAEYPTVRRVISGHKCKSCGARQTPEQRLSRTDRFRVHGRDEAQRRAGVPEPCLTSGHLDMPAGLCARA